MIQPTPAVQRFPRRRDEKRGGEPKGTTSEEKRLFICIWTETNGGPKFHFRSFFLFFCRGCRCCCILLLRYIKILGAWAKGQSTHTVSKNTARVLLGVGAAGAKQDLDEGQQNRVLEQRTECGQKGAGHCWAGRAAKEIRLLLTPHPTCWHQQQMAQPPAAGRASHLHPSAHACLPHPQGWRWGGAGQSSGPTWWKHHLESTLGTGGNVTQCSATMRWTSKTILALSKVLLHPHAAPQKECLGEEGVGEAPEQLPERAGACWPRRGHLIIQHLLRYTTFQEQHQPTGDPMVTANILDTHEAHCRIRKNKERYRGKGWAQDITAAQRRASPTGEGASSSLSWHWLYKGVRQSEKRWVKGGQGTLRRRNSTCKSLEAEENQQVRVILSLPLLPLVTFTRSRLLGLSWDPSTMQPMGTPGHLVLPNLSLLRGRNWGLERAHDLPRDTGLVMAEPKLSSPNSSLS